MTAEEPLVVRTYASVMPLAPYLFDDMDAAGAFLDDHHGCYEIWQALGSLEIRRSSKPCDDEAAHDRFFHPSIFAPSVRGLP